jgi:hypothetical protein
MGRPDRSSALPLVDDLTVKDSFAEFCTGLNFVHGNVHMTFAHLREITVQTKPRQAELCQLALSCR